MIGGRWGRAPGIASASSTRSGLSANSSPRSPTCDPAGRDGLPHRRIRSHPAGRDCHLSLCPSDGANPTPPSCSAGPAVRPCGSSSGAGSCRAAVGLTPQGGVSRPSAREKCRPRRAGSALLAWPRRENHGAVEKPQGWRASLALHILPDVTTSTLQDGIPPASTPLLL